MIVAFVILVLFAAALYGMDHDLRTLRDEMVRTGFGAGEPVGDAPMVRDPGGLTATLTAASVAGAVHLFDQETA